MQQLLTEAETLPGIASYLDPSTTTLLFDTLSAYEDGAAIGQRIIDCWIKSFLSNTQQVSDTTLFNRQLHPDIHCALAEFKARAQDMLTIVDVCTTINEQSGWGTTEEMVMKRATVDDFETAIRQMDIDVLQKFMRRMIKMSLQEQTYKQYFGQATDRFVEACRLIANDQNSPRLAKLIRILFEKTRLAEQLDRQNAGAESPMT